MKEAEWVAEDLFDHRSQREMFDEIRERPTREEKEHMSRLESDMKEIEGVHIDNGILKNKFEDIEHLFEEVEDFMDPKNPLQAEGIKLDAAMRFSPKVQELMKMIMKDFGIKSFHDLERAVEKVGMHIYKDVRRCPYFRRMRKGVERMVRFAMRNVRVSDLPKGKRM